MPADAPDDRQAEEEERLARERAELPEEAAVATRVISGTGVAESIVAAASGYDAVMVGASGQSFSNNILFGTLPERIAREAEGTVLVFKGHDRVRAFVGRVAAD